MNNVERGIALNIFSANSQQNTIAKPRSQQKQKKKKFKTQFQKN